MRPPEPEFDRYAEKYDDLLADPIRDRFSGESAQFFHQRKLDLLLEFFRQQQIDPRSLQWLDLGCGRGDLLRMGKPSFGSVAGCDVSSEMLKHAPDIEIRQQSAMQQIPFPDREFHLVTAVCVYHHVVPQQRLSLTHEIFRVLKPGGVGCIIEHNPWNPITRLIVSRCPVDFDAKLLSVLTAKRVFKDANMQPLSAQHFLYLPLGLYSKFRVVERVLASVPFGGQYAVFARRAG